MSNNKKIFVNQRRSNRERRVRYCFLRQLNLNRNTVRSIVGSFDFIKIDIEGYEETLLKHMNILTKPMIIETHGIPLYNRFIKAGFRPYRNNYDTESDMVGCTRYVYWKC